MLEINPEIICCIVEKARQFHVKEEVVIPEPPLNPADFTSFQILADHTDDPIYSEFLSIIRDLENDQKIVVIALLWIGRGDYSLEEWEIAKDNAKLINPKKVGQYLLSHPLLADYLLEGLAQFGYSCE